MSLTISNLATVLSEKNAVINPMLAEAPSRLRDSQRNLMGSINEDDDAMVGDEERGIEATRVTSTTSGTSPSRSLLLLQRPSSARMGSIPSINEVLITFPLPGKDPLLEYRKMYDFAKAFNVEDDSSAFFKYVSVSYWRYSLILPQGVSSSP